MNDLVIHKLKKNLPNLGSSPDEEILSARSLIDKYESSIKKYKHYIEILDKGKKLSCLVNCFVDPIVTKHYINEVCETKIKDAERSIESAEQRIKNAENELTKFFETLNEKESQTSEFQNMLFYLINKKGISDPDLYNSANVSKQVFSKIKQNVIPNISTVVRLAIGLKCNYDEMTELLTSAGYALSKNNAYDRLIKLIFINKVFYDYRDYTNYLKYFEYFEYIKNKCPHHRNRYADWFKSQK